MDPNHRSIRALLISLGGVFLLSGSSQGYFCKWDPNRGTYAKDPIQIFLNMSVRHQEPVPFAPSKKHSHEDENRKSKSKKKPIATREGKAPVWKLSFSRVFSKEDEVALMKGLIDFSMRNGADAATVVKNMDLFESFHMSGGRTLHTSVTIEQLKNKIQQLKKRWGKNDSTLTEMSERLWRSEKGDFATKNGKGRRKSKKNLVETMLMR
ncbi:hypothetical protein QJS10_CPB20g00412 [Acorus calamus]|uniref:Glabrous enhancer-binding protein-like DBD domain-containing protein n=1 Tax=Acorus calamus TaxID=4465 RepID=A0AAV9C9G3_ACOCL|nr:hypothetical protein QJS10_CPB20g00412 [Acorus calamus]